MLLCGFVCTREFGVRLLIHNLHTIYAKYLTTSLVCVQVVRQFSQDK